VIELDRPAPYVCDATGHRGSLSIVITNIRLWRRDLALPLPGEAEAATRAPIRALSICRLFVVHPDISWLLLATRVRIRVGRGLMSILAGFSAGIPH